MGFKCGIVGLPNAGKSTIFNAITGTANAQVANYPFCTIDPNVGCMPVPDQRLPILAKIASSANIIPTSLDIVDIAGLVKGASSGEGLGNQFLSNIREVDVIMHVVRCFENNDIIHTLDNVDPVRDIEIIETELLLSDLSLLEKRLQNIQKKMKSGDKFAIEEGDVIERLLVAINQTKPVSSVMLSEHERRLVQFNTLITGKPVMYVANVDEELLIKNEGGTLAEVIEIAKTRGWPVVPLCAKLEAELMGFDDNEKSSLLTEIGYSDTGLARAISNGYRLLDLITFFTVGPKETRAWTVKSGTKAPQAAGVIHSDFERGFIKAETISYDDFVKYDGESGAKANAKMRSEGKEYVVQDGDVFHFRFNV